MDAFQPLVRAAERLGKDPKESDHVLGDTKANSPDESQPLTRQEQLSAWTQRWWRSGGTVAAVALALLLGWHVVYGTHGLSFWLKERAQDRALRAQIQSLQQENATLAQHVEKLKSDPDAIEREAREKLHYAKPGEVIYTLPDPPKDQPAAPSK